MNTDGNRLAGRASMGMLVVWLSLTGSFAAAPADGPAPTSGAIPTQSVSLTFEDVPYAFYEWYLPASERATPFEKEPEKSGNVIRGTLQCGKGGTNQVGFLWDRGAGKLYVDLNRNLDMTDDPSSVFSSADRRDAAYQTFTNVHLPMATAEGIRSTTVDLSLYGYTLPRLFANAGLRSLWLGQVTLNERPWQVGIVEDPETIQGGTGTMRHLLFRPWDDREKTFQMGDGASPVFAFSANLFLNGRAYELAARSTSADNRDRIELTFAEQHPALGELRLTGQFVDQLALEGSSLVILDRPASVVRAPVGRYTQWNVRLRNGDVEAVRDTRHAGKGVTVSDSETAALAVGGPLTNSVTVNRRGRTLVFNYQLLGAGGETYRVIRDGVRQPPEFTAYQGEKKIASGKFEFG